MDTTRGAGAASAAAFAARPWSARPTWAEARTGVRRSLVLFWLSVRALGLGLWLAVVYTFLWTGLSVPLLPGSQRAVRRLVDRQRELAQRWSGIAVPARYPSLSGSGQGSQLHTLIVRRHNQVWRDWRFVVIDPLAGGVIAFVPAALLLSSVWGLATAVFGGLTPYLAQVLVERTGMASIPGAMIAAVAVAVLPVFVLMRETAPRFAERFALGNRRN